MRRAAGEMSRATRHTRTPAPPQTYSAPPGAATRPSSSPIHRRLANRAPAMMARGGPPWKPQRRHDPVGTSLDSRRVPLRAARGAPSLNTDAPARRRLDIADKTIPSASSTRARGSPPIATPLDLPEGRTREGEGARPCPGGAPGRPARRGARVLGGPVPSTLFVIHEIPRATGCCASGRRTSVSHQLALFWAVGAFVIVGTRLANPSFIYYICHQSARSGRRGHHGTDEPHVVVAARPWIHTRYSDTVRTSRILRRHPGLGGVASSRRRACPPERRSSPEARRGHNGR